MDSQDESQTFRRILGIELRLDLSAQELGQRLRMIEQEVRSSDPSNVRDYSSVFEFVASKFMFTYPDKALQLISASIIAELLERFPIQVRNNYQHEHLENDNLGRFMHTFINEHKLQEILNFFSCQLHNFSTCGSTLYKRFINLVEKLTAVNPYRYGMYLGDCVSVLRLLLAKIIFVISSGGVDSSKIISFGLIAAPSLIMQIDLIPNDIVESLLVHLLNTNEKKVRPVVEFCSNLLRRASASLQLHTNGYLCDKLAKSQVVKKPTKEQKQLQEHVYDLIPVLWSLSPSLVSSTLDIIGRKLRADDVLVKVKAASTVATIVGCCDGHMLISVHPYLWKTFIACCEDNDVKLRQICVKALGDVAKTNFNSVVSEEIPVQLLKRSLDTDVSVRRDTVHAIANCLVSSEEFSGRNMLTKCIMERTRDIKFPVREAAVSSLGRVFCAYWQREQSSSGAHWVDTILHMYCSSFAEDRVVVEQTIRNHVLNHSLSVTERVDRLLWLSANVDQVSVRCLKEILHVRQVLSSLLRPTLDLLKQGTLPGDSDSAGSSSRQLVPGSSNKPAYERLLQADMVQLALAKLKQLSLYLSGGANTEVKVHRSIWTLVKWAHKDKEMLSVLTELTDPSCSCDHARKHMETVKTKLIQVGPQMRDGINSFVSRLSPLVDDAAVAALVTRLEHTIPSPGIQESYQDAKSCIRLLAIMSRLHGNCFKRHDILNSLMNIMRNGQEDIVDGVLQVLTNVGHFVTEAQNSRSLVEILQRTAIEGSPKLSKHSVICISSVFVTEMKSIFERLCMKLIPRMKLESAKVSVLLVALGYMVERCPELANSSFDLNKAESFVVDTLINVPILPNNVSSDEMLCTKIQGLKMLMRFAIGLNERNKSFTERVIRFLSGLVAGSCQQASDSVSDKSESIHLGVQAGCCILRMARVPACNNALTFNETYNLSLLFTSEIVEVHSRLVQKLHRGLITLRLPLSFASMFCLAALWSESSNVGSEFVLSKSDVRQMLAANVTKRRQILSIRASSFDVSTVSSILPEYIVPFTIHLLSHRIASCDDVEAVVAVNQCLQMLLGVLTHKHCFNTKFYSSVFDMIRQSKDAVEPKSSTANLKLHTVCELARSILSNIRPARSSTIADFCPSDVVLPRKCFTSYRSDRKIARINISAELLNMYVKQPRNKRSRSTAASSILRSPLKKKKMSNLPAVVKTGNDYSIVCERKYVNKADSKCKRSKINQNHAKESDDSSDSPVTKESHPTKTRATVSCSPVSRNITASCSWKRNSNAGITYESSSPTAMSSPKHSAISSSVTKRNVEQASGRVELTNHECGESHVKATVASGQSLTRKRHRQEKQKPECNLSLSDEIAQEMCPFDEVEDNLTSSFTDDQLERGCDAKEEDLPSARIPNSSLSKSSSARERCHSTKDNGRNNNSTACIHVLDVELQTNNTRSKTANDQRGHILTSSPRRETNASLQEAVHRATASTKSPKKHNNKQLEKLKHLVDNEQSDVELQCSSYRDVENAKPIRWDFSDDERTDLLDISMLSSCGFVDLEEDVCESRTSNVNNDENRSTIDGNYSLGSQNCSCSLGVSKNIKGLKADNHNIVDEDILMGAHNRIGSSNDHGSARSVVVLEDNCDITNDANGRSLAGSRSPQRREAISNVHANASKSEGHGCLTGCESPPPRVVSEDKPLGVGEEEDCGSFTGCQSPPVKVSSKDALPNNLDIEKGSSTFSTTESPCSPIVWENGVVLSLAAEESSSDCNHFVSMNPTVVVDNASASPLGNIAIREITCITPDLLIRPYEEVSEKTYSMTSVEAIASVYGQSELDASSEFVKSLSRNRSNLGTSLNTPKVSIAECVSIQTEQTVVLSGGKQKEHSHIRSMIYERETRRRFSGQHSAANSAQVIVGGEQSCSQVSMKYASGKKTSLVVPRDTDVITDNTHAGDNEDTRGKSPDGDNGVIVNGESQAGSQVQLSQNGFPKLTPTSLKKASLPAKPIVNRKAARRISNTIEQLDIAEFLSDTFVEGESHVADLTANSLQLSTAQSSQIAYAYKVKNTLRNSTTDSHSFEAKQAVEEEQSIKRVSNKDGVYIALNVIQGHDEAEENVSSVGCVDKRNSSCPQNIIFSSSQYDQQQHLIVNGESVSQSSTLQQLNEVSRNTTETSEERGQDINNKLSYTDNHSIGSQPLGSLKKHAESSAKVSISKCNYHVNDGESSKADGGINSAQVLTKTGQRRMSEVETVINSTARSEPAMALYVGANVAGDTTRVRGSTALSSSSTSQTGVNKGGIQREIDEKRSRDCNGSSPKVSEPLEKSIVTNWSEGHVGIQKMNSETEKVQLRILKKRKVSEAISPQHKFNRSRNSLATDVCSETGIECDRSIKVMSSTMPCDLPSINEQLPSVIETAFPVHTKRGSAYRDQHKHENRSTKTVSNEMVNSTANDLSREKESKNVASVKVGSQQQCSSQVSVVLELPDEDSQVVTSENTQNSASTTREAVLLSVSRQKVSTASKPIDVLKSVGKTRNAKRQLSLDELFGNSSFVLAVNANAGSYAAPAANQNVYSSDSARKNTAALESKCSISQGHVTRGLSDTPPCGHSLTSKTSSMTGIVEPNDKNVVFNEAASCEQVSKAHGQIISGESEEKRCISQQKCSVSVVRM